MTDKQTIKLQYDPRRDATSVLMQIDRDGKKSWCEVGAISARERAKIQRTPSNASDSMTDLATLELQRFYSLVLNRRYMYKPSSKNPVALTEDNMCLVHKEEVRLCIRFHEALAKVLSAGWDFRNDDPATRQLKCHVADLVSALVSLEKLGHEAEMREIEAEERAEAEAKARHEAELDE